jgi:hypothetical protein
MARKPKNKMAENIGDFAGPDADRENIEKLAKAAEEANAKAGHNSGEPPDEVISRTFNAIEVAWSEIDAAGRIMQKARAGLAAARKTAKTDCGAKSWVDSVEAAVKLKRQTDKSGAGELVTEHRQIGRVLRIMNVPIGTQFNLFAVREDGVEGKTGAAPSGMDAELQGQHAFSNSEDRGNNPFQQGSEDFVAWDTGFMNAMSATARKMGPDGEAAAH